MPIPLIVAGLAGFAGIALAVGGCSEEPQSTRDDPPGKDPCDDHDCGGHGACVPTSDSYVCVCDRGYYAGGGTCMAETVADGDVGVEDGEGQEDAGANAVSNCACVSRSSFSCMLNQEIRVGMKCRDNEQCEEGACVTKPGELDPACGEGMRSSCAVTDIFDVIEDTGHQVSNSCDHTGLGGRYLGSCCDSTCIQGAYQCNEDKAYYLFGNYDQGQDQPVLDNWVAFTASITPAPPFTHYRFDAKLDWFYLAYRIAEYYNDPLEPPPESCRDMLEPSLDVMFGDDQRQAIPLSDDWKRCVYQGMATFTAAGVSDDTIRIQLRNNGSHCKPEGHLWYHGILALSKARVWSCQCIE